MRLTINLEPELHAVAVSLAKAEDCSISAAVNRLVRRALPGAEPDRAGIAARMERRNGLLVSRGREVVTAEMVQRIEAEDDANSDLLREPEHDYHTAWAAFTARLS